VAQRSQLQLIGVTCMWIAAKYEEIYPPNVSDFCYITDNTYTRQQMIAMEELVLKTLSYELCIPTPKIFLRRLLQVCNPDEHLHFLSNYLTELALLDYNMLNFLPSIVAASGVFLANIMLKRQAWNGNPIYIGFRSMNLRFIPNGGQG
jgi:cyclin A